MPGKILVIDDEKSYREVILAALGNAGYEVFEAENGAQGLEVARRQAPDLILCDLMMPGLSGYETLVALRGDPATAAIPLVFMSGFSDTPSKQRALELGVADFVEKPFALAELLAVVEAKLGKRG